VAFYNGEDLVSEAYLGSGSTITKPADPTKESTAQYHFNFAGWSLDGVNIVDVTVAGEDDMTFYAVFTEELRTYTIRFLNGTTVLESKTWNYGDMPVYAGSEPVDPNGDDFSGWIPEIGVVTGNVDYVAKFRPASVARAYVKGTLKSLESDVVTSVGDYAFNFNYKLTSVNLPNATTVGVSAFSSASALTSVNIPNVETIGNYAFRSCTKLPSIDLLKATILKDECFASCTALASVRLPATPPTLDKTSALRNLNSACVFYVPTGSLAAYQSATNWSEIMNTYTFVEEDR
jgi:hypothetical protein